MSGQVNVMWFRRDLRLTDNAALYRALKIGMPVVPIFIFDTDILDQLEYKADRRVEFIRAALVEMQQSLLERGTSMEVYYGRPIDIIKQISKKYELGAVYTNHDYEPYAIARDAEVGSYLQANGIAFKTYKDQVIFEKDEVMKDDGTPYTVFTPYSRKWKAKLNDFYLKSYPVEKYISSFYKQEAVAIPTLQHMGFETVDEPFPGRELNEEIIKKYDTTRNFPGNEQGTSRLGVHLRFGTISVRKLASLSLQLNQTYLNELIWRDFYQIILCHFQKVGKGRAFRSEYEQIPWRNDEQEFKLWCDGNTGYPIVDAGMRELNATGYMHNRVRMIVASFLTKHLLIDWRWGEAYFAQKLLDFDLASNNGGWQWAAGSGVDAAPYFRIFNPTLQTQKFDKDLGYIRKWVPEFEEFTYTKPIVQHEYARKRALEVYGNALKK